MKVILPFVIDTTIRDSIIKFINTSDSSFWIINTTGNTFNRRFCPLNQFNTPLTAIIKEYSKYIYSLLNITHQVDELKFGNFIGCNTEGGYVHPHTDQLNVQGWEHVRINFLVSKPFQGGNPVIENKEYNIIENGAWFNLASKWVHSSTPVIGTKSRVVLSLGAYVNPNELNEAKVY